MTALPATEERFQDIATRIQTAALATALEALDEDRQEYAREIERSASLKEEAEEEIRQLEIASQRATPNDIRPATASDVAGDLQEAQTFVRSLFEGSLEDGSFERLLEDPVDSVAEISRETPEALDDTREALKNMLEQDWKAMALDSVLDGVEAKPKTTSHIALATAKSMATALSTASTRLEGLRARVKEAELAVAQRSTTEKILERDLKNAEKEADLLIKMKAESLKELEAQALRGPTMGGFLDNRLRISPVVLPLEETKPASVPMKTPASAREPRAASQRGQQEELQRGERAPNADSNNNNSNNSNSNTISKLGNPEGPELYKKSPILSDFAASKRMLDAKLMKLAAEGHAAIDLDPCFWGRYRRPQIWVPALARKNITLSPLGNAAPPTMTPRTELKPQIPTEPAHPPQQFPNTTESSETSTSKPPHKMPDGATYTGEWKGEQRHGHGVQVWPDGAKYEGQWQNDKAHGEGRFDHVGGDVYVGQWLNDKADGIGTYEQANGSAYTGQWKQDQQHGDGEEVWPDGAKYVGQYKEGMKEGIGHFHWADGSDYQGSFLTNKIHGEGSYSWADGRRYEGQWADGKMAGKGKFTWPDGRLYVGEFVNDLKEGQGKYLWPDGRSYEGSWLGGKQHGKGLYANAHGIERVGEWDHGKRLHWDAV